MQHAAPNMGRKMRSDTYNNITTPADLASKRWLIVLTIMMLAILEVLDSTIVNVSLPAMMASLGADQSQVTWVLTSYVVASAIVLPITGFLTNRFGQKKFLFICASGFMISSLLCGASQSLIEMVIFRILQGAFGASLIPISQAILRQTFPLEEQGKAMAIWGLGIMAAPVFGPTLGGYITEYASWRWIFYINLPLCLVGLFLIRAVIPDTKKIKASIDKFGLFLMVIGVGALQVFLDKGNDNGWFSSNMILALAVICVLSLTFFIIRCVKQKHPVVNLKLYKNRNFAISCLMMLGFTGMMFGFISLAPIMLQHLFGYTAIQAGLNTMPMGIASGVAMATASAMMKRVNVKVIITIGLICCFIGAFRYSHCNLDVGQHHFWINNIFLGFGMGNFMVPISTYSLATISEEHTTEASGLFSYSRMLGTSIGISLLSTLVSRMTQVSWHSLTGNVTHFNNNLTLWLQHQHLRSLSGPALARLSSQISSQASMIAFVDAFKVISIVFLLLIPLVWLLKSVKLDGNSPGAH
jgi:DHA2 family multidrug resistance protein